MNFSYPRLLVVTATLFPVLLGVPSRAEEATPSASPEAKAEASAPAKAAEAPAETGGGKFTGEAAKIKEHMEGLFDTSKKVNKPAETKAASRAKIEGALDWDGIAQACLGKNASKGNETQRNQFRDLLRDVAVKTAYTRLDTFWEGATYKFDLIDVKGNTAHVRSTFRDKSGSGFSLDYYMVKKGGQWLINDIAVKNERYSVNIREQINEFMAQGQGNFGKLLEKLKKRREELDRDAQSSKKPKKA